MAGSSIPGSLGVGSNTPIIDAGTLPKTASQLPGPVGMTAISIKVKSPAADEVVIFLYAAIASKLSMSKQGLTLLKQVEQLHLKPYDDQTGKRVSDWTQGATIGYGHLIKQAEWNTYKNGITAPDADTLFDRDLAPFIIAVQSNVKASLKQSQFDALVILAFNIGPDAFPGSSVVTLVNDHKATTKYKDLESAWKAWNKSQGKVMKGLENRRQCEWDIYSQGIYKMW